jgi:hypothetical protein
MDSRWGVTAHKVILMVCNDCQFIMPFSKGRTVWDFDLLVPASARTEQGDQPSKLRLP